MAAADKVRQAVVIVHGMGEQRPTQTLNGFIASALPTGENGIRDFYSRPDRVTESYEARRYLAPPQRVQAPDGGTAEIAQTEFYEYHWAHLMQGNRIDDLWPTFRKMLLRSPKKVPAGLRVVWVLFWAIVLAAVWALLWGPWSDIVLRDLSAEVVIGAIVGGGLTATALTYLVSRVLPGWLTTSFVDVVRYLDTSPRSYQVRKDIRKGIVQLLEGLHAATLEDKQPRYQRIVIVAHSLGAYIAYDAITYLWAQMNTKHAGRNVGLEVPAGLREVEESASGLVGDSKGSVDEYQAAQRELWAGLRAQGSPWLITDFISVGTPMYFAHNLYTKDEKEFGERVRRLELPTCPPQPEGEKEKSGRYNNIHKQKLWFSYKSGGKRVLYHGAPFAVVRWTNMWFPPEAGFFGDWFGGPLRPLFGNGIRDIPLRGNGRKRWLPAYAHALYFKFAEDTTSESVTTHLRRGLDLGSTTWLEQTVPPEARPGSQPSA